MPTARMNYWLIPSSRRWRSTYRSRTTHCIRFPPLLPRSRESTKVRCASARFASTAAVVQAEENLGLVRIRYRNGKASPTDVVDSETAMTRSQQSLYSATYPYLSSLARLDYTVGHHQGVFLGKEADST